MLRTFALGRPRSFGFQAPVRRRPSRLSTAAVLRPRRRWSVGVGSISAGGGLGRAFAFMRAAASARVAGGEAGATGVGAVGPACAGGGAEGPALSRKKYGETPVLAAVLKMSPRLKRLPIPGAATTSTSSSILTASSAGAACVFRNHGSSGGTPFPVATGVGEAGVGVGVGNKCRCWRHRLHGNISRYNRHSNHFIDGRRRGFNSGHRRCRHFNSGCRRCRHFNSGWRWGFNSTWCGVAGASTVFSKARIRWWLALQTQTARRRRLVATRWNPATARNCICMKAANGRVEEAAKTTMAMAMGNVAANTRPKALEDAAALSMVAVVADRATANSADAAKGEKQSTSNVRRAGGGACRLPITRRAHAASLLLFGLAGAPAPVRAAEEGVLGAIKSIFDPNEKTKAGKTLPKAYLKAAREVVRTLRESLEEDDGGDMARFRRNADAAKESIREFLGGWRGQQAVAAEESYVALEKAIRSLAEFYSKAGPSAPLPQDVKNKILDDLSTADAYL